MKGGWRAIESGLTTCLDSRHAAWPHEIKSLIGSGGTGEVYQAHDGRLNRTAAIKPLIYEQADAIRKTSCQRP